MTTKKFGLGKGLGALIPSGEDTNAAQGPAASKLENIKGLDEISVSAIQRNPYQPRRTFEDSALNELAASIREQGLLQPIIVRKKGEHYELIAGERRLRAAQKAGLARIPALVRDYTDAEAAQLTLIENLQREDLNPVEEARGFLRLTNDFGMTHEQLAQKIGKSRPEITNTLRLMQLPENILAAIEKNEISKGHARCMLSLEDKTMQEALFQEVTKHHLSVRQTEQLLNKLNTGKTKRTKTKKAPVIHPDAIYIQDFEEKLKTALATKVTIAHAGTTGTINITYYSLEDLERLAERILG